MMRYYWGFAIGHTYAHDWQSVTLASQGLTEEDDDNPPLDPNYLEPEINTGDELEFSLESLEDDIPVEDDDSIVEDDPAANSYGDINPNDHHDVYA